MYAVIKTGGKQYRVAPGQTLRVELLTVPAGDAVNFSDVLMVVDGEKIKIGQPLLAGASVQAKVLEHGRGEKIRIIKMKRRKNHRKRMGHRQHFTKIEITAIQAA